MIHPFPTPALSSRRRPSLLVAGLGLALLATSPGQAGTPPKVDIPFTTFTLDNGLKVIFHEDHSVPLVAVNLGYLVGSKDEQEGRTGFAHLFEHLMFMGTARAPRGKFDEWMETEGGWNNAWTSEDRTDYFEVGPSHILPLFLWLEADRLQTLGSQIDTEKLNLQRDVVRNERRQTSEGVPYGAAELRLPELLHPKGHPYHHPVIGSHEDLQAATVADVQQFFSRFYVPRNASLVVAGDFNPKETEILVRRYFGYLPGGALPERPAAAQGRTDPQTFGKAPPPETVTDRVEAPRVIFAWRSPAHFAHGDAELDLLGSILSSGKASELYQSLVYEQQVAQDVYAAQWSAHLESSFVVWATAREGVSVETLEAALKKQLDRVLAEGTTNDAVDRARNGIQMSFLSRLQSVAERASLLNTYQAELGDPGQATRDLARYTEASAASVNATARATLLPERTVILRIVPAPESPTAPAPEGETK